MVIQTTMHRHLKIIISRCNHYHNLTIDLTNCHYYYNWF